MTALVRMHVIATYRRYDRAVAVAGIALDPVEWTLDGLEVPGDCYATSGIARRFRPLGPSQSLCRGRTGAEARRNAVDLRVGADRRWSGDDIEVGDAIEWSSGRRLAGAAVVVEISDERIVYARCSGLPEAVRWGHRRREAMQRNSMAVERRREEWLAAEEERRNPPEPIPDDDLEAIGALF